MRFCEALRGLVGMVMGADAGAGVMGTKEWVAEVAERGDVGSCTEDGLGTGSVEFTAPLPYNAPGDCVCDRGGGTKSDPCGDSVECA